MQGKPDLETLGQELRGRRRALRVSGTQLARQLGVSPGYLWLIEQARPRPGGQPSRPGEELLGRWLQALMLEGEEAARFRVLAGYSAQPPAGDAVDRTLSRDDELRLAYLEGLREGRRRAVASSRAESLEVLDRQAMEGTLTRELRAVLDRAEATGREQETLRLLRSLLQWLKAYISRSS